MPFESGKVCCFYPRLHLKKLGRLVVLFLLEQLGMSRILARFVSLLLILIVEMPYHCQLEELV